LPSVELHPSFEDRLDPYGGLDLPKVSIFDMPLDAKAYFGECLFGDFSAARGVGITTYEAINLRCIFGDLFSINVV
jgi:hypothetical protein